jgi:predicted nucleic-acid-binding protein
LIAVDTNGLVRILADDPGQPAQVQVARQLASEAKRVFVPSIVQVETVWVLESGYGLSRETLIQALEHLEANQAVVLEDDDRSQRALALFRSCNANIRTLRQNLWAFGVNRCELLSRALKTGEQNLAMRPVGRPFWCKRLQGVRFLS